MSFESIVEELELDYTQKVLQKYSAQERAVIFECGNGCLIEVTTFCKPWLNKMTWLHGLYEAYTDPTGLQYVSDKSVITSNIKANVDAIRMEEYTPVVEVGWRVVYNKHPSEYPREGRRKALFEFMIRTRDNIERGMFGMEPSPGIVLSARPFGPNIDDGFGKESMNEGIQKRASFAQRFGFGEIKTGGFVYGRYDDDCILQPL